MRLDPRSIVSESHAMLPGAGNRALLLLHALERTLAESRTPDLVWREVILRSFRFLPRPGVRALAIRHRCLREWTVYVSAAPSGSYLAVAWYLVERASLRGELKRRLRFGLSPRERETIGSELDFRGRAELARLSALSRQALARAIGEVLAARDAHSASTRGQRRRRGGR